MADFIFPLSQKFRIETTIDIEGEMVPVRVDGQINMQTGIYKVTPVRTTKTVATSPEMNKAITARVNAMTDLMINHFEGMRAEISVGDKVPDLFDELEEVEDVIHAQDQIDYDTGDFVEPAPSKSKGKRAVSASADGDGGPDDELNPGI
jgi:hypothetical protein